MFQRGPHVCISCGSITETKNLSLTAFAITAAADCKTVKTRQKNVVQPFVYLIYLKKKKKLPWKDSFILSVHDMSHQNTVSQHWVRTFCASLMS